MQATVTENSGGTGTQAQRTRGENAPLAGSHAAVRRGRSRARTALAGRAGAKPKPDWRELGAIFLGGAAGALSRLWLSRHFASSPSQWPWVTFSVNLSGSFALGYFVTRLQERLPPSTYRRPALGTGFCGAYTTFSTMQLELLRMIESKRYELALGYATASVTAGYFAVWLATATVRRTRVLL
jgi:CrcB protein